VIYDIVRQLPVDLLTLAHQGTKVYSEAFDLVHRREATGPNAIWQADHSPLDLLLVRPGGEPAKPWLTIVMDDYSRAVSGYLLSFEPPSTLHTSLALRQGIWRKDDTRWNICGIPDVLYTDHGSDTWCSDVQSRRANTEGRNRAPLNGTSRALKWSAPLSQIADKDLRHIIPKVTAGRTALPFLSVITSFAISYRRLPEIRVGQGAISQA
jgi:transposase InsO family protein